MSSSFSCEECGTSFGTREELREHNIKSHIDEKAETARRNAESTQSANN